MAHGGYGRRRIEERRPLGRRSKGSGVDKKQKKPKSVSLKNQIRSTERFLRKFFPKTEKYVSLFVGGDNPDIILKKNNLRDQIKSNRVAAAANGKDLEETASDDDALDLSEDDFFLSGSSSDEAEADDEWTDKSAREPASSASGRATSGMSSDEKNQISARVLMPPPRSLPPSRSQYRDKVDLSTSFNTSNRGSGPSSRGLRSMSTSKDQHGNLSSISDAQKPRRRRRPKKKKQG